MSDPQDTPDSKSDSDASSPGVFYNPLTGEELVDPTLAAKAQADFEIRHAAEQRMQELIKQGWKRPTEIEREAGLRTLTVSAKSNRLDPDGLYPPDGTVSEKRDKASFVRGRSLRWEHPFRSVTLLAPSYANGIINAEKKKQDLLEKGYKPQYEVADEIGLNRRVLARRTLRLSANKEYQPTGYPLTGSEGEQAVKGSELRWKHPYNKREILLSPNYIAGIEAAESKQHELEKRGYLLQSEVEKEGLIDIKNLAADRTAKINSEKDYYPDGTLAESGAPGAVKGSELWWQHPFQKDMVLLAPTFVQGMIAADRTEKELLSHGYQFRSKVMETAGTTSQVIRGYSKRIKPNNHYLPSGEEANPHDENAILGSELVWRHPYNCKIILLHPQYAQRIIRVEEEEKELLRQDYQPLHVAAKKHGIKPATLSARIRRQQKEAGPNQEKEIIWHHPFDGSTVLLHPDFIARIQPVDKSKVSKSAMVEPLGEATSLPPAIQQQLDSQRERKEPELGL